jgi:hypothetical protein
LIEVPVKAQVLALRATSDAYRFSAAVASFGMLRRDSEHKGGASYASLPCCRERTILAVCSRGSKSELEGVTARAANDCDVEFAP